MKRANTPEERKVLKIRKIIETVIGKLTDRFHIEKVNAKDM